MKIDYVEKHTIFETIVGSQAYGIDTPESDIDKAGVMIPDQAYFLGLNRFEQFDDYPEEDKVMYDIRKALKLIADNNPNCLDLLCSPERCITKMTPYWQEIVENKDLFISKKARFTFSSYAIAQLERIKMHRKFLLAPIKNKPLRSDYGLPEHSSFPSVQLKSIVQATMHDFLMEEHKEDFFHELDGIYGDYLMPLFAKFSKETHRNVAMEWIQETQKSQINTLLHLGPSYIKEEFIDLAEKELRYFVANQEYERYQQWSKTRNPKRAILEARFGYDTKHAGHLVRLMRMGVEILQTGKVNVDRTQIDSVELKEIKNGAWSYEQLEQYAKDTDNKLTDLYNSCKLQKSAQIEKINELCIKIVDQYLSTTKKKIRDKTITTLAADCFAGLEAHDTVVSRLYISNNLMTKDFLKYANDSYDNRIWGANLQVMNDVENTIIVKSEYKCGSFSQTSLFNDNEIIEPIRHGDKDPTCSVCKIIKKLGLQSNVSTKKVIELLDYEHCPHCYGSFSFSKPENAICPFCKKSIIGE
jgi:hypothetical protein